MNRPFRFPVAAAFLSAVSLFALTGCGRKSTQQAGALPPQQVQVITVQAQPVHVSTRLPGRLEAFEIAMVRPQVTGVIQKRLFTEGADVVTGQQLYQIDPSAYQAVYDSASGQLAQARANAATAQAKLERYGPLVKAHAVSKQEYDDALASARSADAQILIAKGQVEAASVNLRYTKVDAPITGRIGRSLLTVGALATSGQTGNLAVITRLDPIYVDVNLPAVSLLRLRREVASGRIHTSADNTVPVSLEMEDGSVYDLSGKMEFSEVNVDEATATVIVRAVFPNPKKLLLPGMYVHATLDEGIDPNALLVPQQAVSRNTHGDPQVLAVDADNKVILRPVTTSATHDADWIISSGLKAGDRVIVIGLQKVHPGDKVQPVPFGGDSSPEEKK
ncbi:efflux RND transporter periplasmic adaptor subunit [Acetobacter oeni]|uniref:MexX family efflux pump subunit n=1 Tax=Acetobacter oeni TaxID=304077 RepID=A0A511XGP8_9PROT|nr:efflux RND transporter periplasmic adaptor subunit [Acetobacter oeni]MBB3881709.1 membrane fusion protein (multidrug efflux system) [Acetobacter oeni]NHO17486.1 efflux RND transporter periplasmic adaptor subunit [Acetobacter oeni]GBR05950.1 multidrug efflux pump acriflavin resistance protein AcrB/AcrD/AcrF [Acetobacter oeni LMG 21952]GEN62120.1 MexX family efflux pump subunit [Acetobacter oeni]